jgi:formyltetrahydrofolate deformylase
MQRLILTLSCPDRMVIVAAVGSFLVENGCNIAESAQFGDPATREFFKRVCFSTITAR